MNISSKLHRINKCITLKCIFYHNMLLPLRKKIMPALGPLNVLCTVEVTMSQYSKGEGCNPVATNPATCAISAINKAPQSSAIFLNFP